MELALIPFFTPLLLLGWIVDAWREHNDAKPERIAAKRWEQTWFRFHGRPLSAGRARRSLPPRRR